MNEMQNTSNEVTRTAPERIWIQVSDDAFCCGEAFPQILDESITWCVDSVVDCEVAYVRADLHAALVDENIRLREQVAEFAKFKECVAKNYCASSYCASAVEIDGVVVKLYYDNNESADAAHDALCDMINAELNRGIADMTMPIQQLTDGATNGR